VPPMHVPLVSRDFTVPMQEQSLQPEWSVQLAHIVQKVPPRQVTVLREL